MAVEHCITLVISMWERIRCFTKNMHRGPNNYGVYYPAPQNHTQFCLILVQQGVGQGTKNQTVLCKIEQESHYSTNCQTRNILQIKILGYEGLEKSWQATYIAEYKYVFSDDCR